MADIGDVVKCPLCQGHGELRRSEMIGRLTDQELKTKIDRYLADILNPEGSSEAVAVGADADSRKDFQKKVHSWNPETPIWRRSQKE
jgi:hypothetical protein